MKPRWKILIAMASVLIIAAAINFIPMLRLKTPHMNMFEGKWLNVYYENEKSAAKDVFEYADSETEAIAERLGFSEKQNINVYIYDSQFTMQTKKYGFIAPLLGLDWYIGDNIGTNVLLTSPANPGSAHNYDDVKDAVLHEIVHAYVSVINKHTDLWLNEGTALYLSNGQAFSKEKLEHMKIPTYKQTLTGNPIKFSKAGGYTFAHTYIEYIEKNYSWDKLMELIETGDYQKIFNKSKLDIYTEWTEFLSRYHQ